MTDLMRRAKANAIAQDNALRLQKYGLSPGRTKAVSIGTKKSTPAKSAGGENKPVEIKTVEFKHPVVQLAERSNGYRPTTSAEKTMQEWVEKAIRREEIKADDSRKRAHQQEMATYRRTRDDAGVRNSFANRDHEAIRIQAEQNSQNINRLIQTNTQKELDYITSREYAHKQETARRQAQKRADDLLMEIQKVMDLPDFESQEEYDAYIDAGGKDIWDLRRQYQTEIAKTKPNETLDFAKRQELEILAKGGNNFLSVIEELAKERDHVRSRRGASRASIQENKEYFAKYNQMKEQYGDELDDWLRYADMVRNREASEETVSNWQQFGRDKSDFLSWNTSVATNFGSGLGYIDALGQKMTNAMTGKDYPIDYNTPYQMPAKITNAIRAGATEDKNAVGAFFYNATAGIADSTLAMAMGPAGQAMLGLSSATNAMQAAAERGASDNEALAIGFISGGLEVVTEKIQFDRIFGATKPDELLKPIVRILKNAGLEGTEEGFTTVATTIADCLIAGDKSELNTSVQYYMDSGYSKSQAQAYALADWGKGLGVDVLGGMFSGAVLTGGVEAYNKVTAPLQRYEIVATTKRFDGALLNHPNKARTEFIQYAREHFPSSVINTETGRSFAISRNGLDKFLSGRLWAEKYASGFHIPELIKHAHKVTMAENYHGEQASDIPTYEYFQSILLIDGKPYKAHIRIRNTKMGDKYYGHTISEVDEIEVEPSSVRVSTENNAADEPVDNTENGSKNNISNPTEFVKVKPVDLVELDKETRKKVLDLQRTYEKHHRMADREELEKLWLKSFEREMGDGDSVSKQKGNTGIGRNLQSPEFIREIEAEKGNEAVPLEEFSGMRYDNGKEWEQPENEIEMFRKIGNTGAFSGLPERMSKKNIRAVARAYGVEMKGITLSIDTNEELLRFPITGRADQEHIGGITLFPNAFRSKEELLRTVFHEKIHVEQFKEYGMDYVTKNRAYFEKLAYAAEDEFINRLKKGGYL